MDFRRRPSSNTNSLTISGSVGGSKFTGFRHVHRSDGAVVVKGISDASLSSSNGSTTSASSSSASSSYSSNSIAAEAGFPSASANDGVAASSAQKHSFGVAQQLAKATAALKGREQGATTCPGGGGRHPSPSDIGAALKPYLVAVKRESALVSPSVTSSNRSIRSNSTSSNSSQSGEHQFLHPSAAATSTAACSSTSSSTSGNYLDLKNLQEQSKDQEYGDGRLKRTISDLTNTNNTTCGYDGHDLTAASRTNSNSLDDYEDHRRCVNMLYLAATAAAANDA